MNILFAGTPNSSASILKYLANHENISVKGVITQPNKRGKRGKKLNESPVAIQAKDLELDIFKPKSLDNKELKNIFGKFDDIDYLVVVAYGKMFPAWLISLPRVASVNAHFSILPKYRGASPIQSALLNGDTETGISFIEINSDLDAGDIISLHKIKILSHDNKLTLEKKLTDKCINKIVKTLSDFKDHKILAYLQDNSKATYCKKISKNDSFTNFNEKSLNIINKFRAFYEWPGLAFNHNDITIKIHGIEISKENSEGKPGKIQKIEKDGIYINTKDKMIVITHLQFPNKKIISSTDVYNSYQNFFK